MFTVVQPAGARSCCRILERDEQEVNEWSWDLESARVEWDLLCTKRLETRLSPAEQIRYRAELNRLIRKAELGTVRFISKADRSISRPGHDADIVGVEQAVLELRPQGGSSIRQPTYIIRLYYCEPAAISDQLLALHLASKRAGATGKPDQDAAIREAYSRADEHEVG